MTKHIAASDNCTGGISFYYGISCPNLGHQKLKRKEKKRAPEIAYYCKGVLYLPRLQEFLYAGSQGGFGNGTYNRVFFLTVLEDYDSWDASNPITGCN